MALALNYLEGWYVIKEKINKSNLRNIFRFKPYLLNPCWDTNFRTFLVLLKSGASALGWHPRQYALSFKLNVSFLTGCLTFWTRKTSTLYIFWAPTHFFISLSSHNSFSLSFVYPKKQVQYPVLKTTTNTKSKVNV